MTLYKSKLCSQFKVRIQQLLETTKFYFEKSTWSHLKNSVQPGYFVTSRRNGIFQQCGAYFCVPVSRMKYLSVLWIRTDYLSRVSSVELFFDTFYTLLIHLTSAPIVRFLICFVSMLSLYSICRGWPYQSWQIDEHLQNWPT